MLCCRGVRGSFASLPHEKQTAFRKAVNQGDTAAVAWLLRHDKDGSLPNAANEAGDSPLMLAAWHGQLSIMRLLLEHRAEIDACNCDGNNALHCAAYRGFPELASMLHAHGAQVDVPDSRTGKTALIKAAFRGNGRVVQQLLGWHADAAVEDTRGYTALAFAAALSHDRVLKLLLTARSNPNTQDTFGGTPLMHAAALGKTNSVEALLQAGANPALVDLQGRSALAFALAADHTSVVEVMHQPSFAEGDGGIHRLWRRKAPKAGMLPRAPPACRRRSLVAVPRGGGCGLSASPRSGVHGNRSARGNGFIAGRSQTIPFDDTSRKPRAVPHDAAEAMPRAAPLPAPSSPPPLVKRAGAAHVAAPHPLKLRCGSSAFLRPVEHDWPLPSGQSFLWDRRLEDDHGQKEVPPSARPSRMSQCRESRADSGPDGSSSQTPQRADHSSNHSSNHSSTDDRRAYAPKSDEMREGGQGGHRPLADEECRGIQGSSAQEGRMASVKGADRDVLAPHQDRLGAPIPVGQNPHTAIRL